MADLDPAGIICADCGAGDPQWAVINRGVIVCSECCYVHRNLGRHISQIRSLKNGIWHPSTLQLVDFLYKEGANNIWEHGLLTDQGKEKRKKPMSNDPVIPKKETFIKAKYVDMAFILKPSSSSDLSLEDLNKQLYSCARTSHVETVLRLLACGADPNFADLEKSGNSPMHVAAKEGQPLQIELLFIYGADPAKPNFNGHTPAQLARQEGNIELANRLIELEFDVTDKLSLFLTGRKPDHSKDSHFLVPEVAGQQSDSIKKYKFQLQKLPDQMFEKFVQDVYDEVDRRVTSNEWNAAPPYHLGNHQHVAAFLPPNEKLTATRNQLRQKLAKFDNHSFSILIIDILKDARRRYHGLPLPPDELNISKSLLESSGYNFGLTTPEEDSRDYDEVPDCLNRKSGGSQGTKNSNDRKSDFEDNQKIKNSNGTGINFDDYLELKETIQEALSRLALVTQSSTEVVRSQKSLQRTVERLQDENINLKRELKELQEKHNFISINKRNPSPTITSPIFREPPQIGTIGIPSGNVLQKTTRSTVDSSADEMSNVNEGRIYRSSSTATAAQITAAALNRYGRRHGSFSSGGGSGFQNKDSSGGLRPPPGGGRNGNGQYESFGIVSGSESNQTVNSMSNLRGLFKEDMYPDNLILETELLTGAIKALLTDIQTEGIKANAAFHADSINHHINRIVKVIPASHRIGNVEDCVRQMNSAMKVLSVKCHTVPLESADSTCHAAYDVAKAAKQLLMNVHQRDMD